MLSSVSWAGDSQPNKPLEYVGLQKAATQPTITPS